MHRMFFGLCGNVAVTFKKFLKFTDGIVFYFTMGALIELQGEGANFFCDEILERGGNAVPVVSCGWALDQV